MIQNRNNAKQKKAMFNYGEKWIDFLLDVILAIITLSSAFTLAYDILTMFFGENIPIWAIVVSFVIVVALVIAALILIRKKRKYLSKRKVIEKDYNREKKINQINGALFDSLYRANSEKTRGIFRYTYGNVPKWNPINYRDNILVYDVHEQIRSILISLENVVINIDPARFNDRNVSVEFIYCYPSNTYNECNSEEKNDWKLISSGDISNNIETVTQHYDSKKSFYYLLERCGTVFKNHKFDIINDDLVSLINNKEKGFKKRAYFERDIHDVEFSKKGKIDGSAVGTVLCLRNDNPQVKFVKAILTINTYGEPIFSIDKNSDGEVDKFGLSLEDYSDLFKNRIISTYAKLLESELAQMYIRHSIREGSTCPKTGREKCSNSINCHNRCDFSVMCNCCKPV